MTLDLVAAARPNFMKVAPLYKALLGESSWCLPRLVHTGQHYDANMSDAFFRDLGLPAPDVFLGVGSGTHAEQTGGVMIAYERECRRMRPDWTVVVGDVNSTIACTLAAKKLGIPVAHLEAGLRSGDRSMPEELNRLLTDAIADLLWTPSPDADENLLREGVPAQRIERVGNIMIDSFEMLRGPIAASCASAQLGAQAKTFGVITLHRPSNVDVEERLAAIVDTIQAVCDLAPVVFPIHPRTRKRLEDVGLLKRLESQPRLFVTEPRGYIDFMNLVMNSAFVLTDSGGVQEETTYLQIPCLTLRETTERPITVSQGTNRLVTLESIPEDVYAALSGHWPQGSIPELWDGHTAGRVAASLRRRAMS
jgi:UDP-N-acetylglucosamine 2-epimerase (non-hydrolysing)